MQYYRAPPSIASGANRQFIVPSSQKAYMLDNQGRVLVAESDAPWFSSQGFSPAGNLISDPFINSGIIASGTSSVTLGVLPPNYWIDALILQNLTGNAITGGVNIGSTAGAADIVSALAIGANALTVVADAAVLKRVFSTSVPTSLFVSAVTSWNNANLNAKAILRPF
jgi:hypothetical protein